MKFWISIFLDRIILFYQTLQLRKEFLAPQKRGYLIEIKEEEETSYLIQNLEGLSVVIEVDKIHNYFVQLMKTTGVPIIPFEAMDDVYAGREKIEVLYEKYSPTRPISKRHL